MSAARTTCSPSVANDADFAFGKYHASIGVEVADLLNSDDLRINDFDLARFGINANRGLRPVCAGECWSVGCRSVFPFFWCISTNEKHT